MTDIIDAETADLSLGERYVSARIGYLSALARLAYVLGDDQETLCSGLTQHDEDNRIPLAPPTEVPMPRAIPPALYANNRRTNWPSKTSPRVGWRRRCSAPFAG